MSSGSSRSYRGIPNPPPFPSPLNSTTQSQHTGQASGNTLAGRLPSHTLAQPSARSEGHYMTRYEHTPAKAEASAQRFDKRVDFYDSAAELHELPQRMQEYTQWVQAGRHRKDDPRELGGRKIHSEGPTEPTSGSGGHPDTGYLNWEQAGRLREGMTTDRDGRNSRDWVQGQASYANCSPDFVSAPSSFMQATSSNASLHRPPSPGDEMDIPPYAIPHGYHRDHPWQYDGAGNDGAGAAREDIYGASPRPGRANLTVPAVSAPGSRRDHSSGQGSSSTSTSGEGSSRLPSSQGHSLRRVPATIQEHRPSPATPSSQGHTLRRVPASIQGHRPSPATPSSQGRSSQRQQSSHHTQPAHRSSTQDTHQSSNHRRRNKADTGCCELM